MLTEERRARILREIARRGKIEVAAFAETWGFSEMTIRRDLDALASEGLVRRVRGGAVPRREGAGLLPERGTTRGTLGLIVPDAGRHFSGVIRGAGEAARTAGYRLVVGSSLSSRAEESAQLARMLEAGIDGLLFAPAVAAAPEPLGWEQIRDLPVPVVIVEPAPLRLPTDLRADVVQSDHRHGARIAVEHLAGKGYGRVALFAPDPVTALTLQRGFRCAVAELALDADAPEVAFGGHGDAPPLSGSVTAFLRHCEEEAVHAAFVGSDEAAALMLLELRRAGSRVPDDFAMVVYGDDSAGLTGTPLSAVALPSLAVGARAAALCVQRLEQDLPASPAKLSLVPHLIPRESSRTTLSRSREMLRVS